MSKCLFLFSTPLSFFKTALSLLKAALSLLRSPLSFLLRYMATLKGASLLPPEWSGLGLLTFTNSFANFYFLP